MFDDERLYHDHNTSQKLRMRQQGFGHQQRSKSLWIVCPDPTMEKPLLPIRERNTPMIVRRHLYGPSGDIVEDSDGIKFIEHAVEFSNVQDLVICENSLCTTVFKDRQQGLHQVETDPMTGLLRRVRLREALNQVARERLVRDLSNLERNPVIVDAMARRNLLVYGLFYLAESGTFTLYNKARKQFLPV